jgi:hypothetical protein
VRGFAQSHEEVIQQRIGMASFGECGPGEAESTEPKHPSEACSGRAGSSHCYPQGDSFTELPHGCVELDLIAPQVPAEFPSFGTLEATWRNGAGSGVDPSGVEVEPEWGGLLAAPQLGGTELASTTTRLKLLGAEGQELITMR